MYGQRIRKLRQEKKLTAKQFGEIFNLAESTISGYENESRKVDIDTLQKFADFFDVDTDYILGRSNIRKKDGMETDPDVQFIARSKKEMSPKQFQRMMELTKKAKEMFTDDGD